MKEVDKVMVIMLVGCMASVAIWRFDNSGIRGHQGPLSEAMSSIVGSVATLKPSAVGGHRVVVCFLCSSTEVAWM